MKIHSVAILGAGAVGSYVIWGLSGKQDIQLGVIAEGARARRLKEWQGLPSGGLGPAGSPQRRSADRSAEIRCTARGTGKHQSRGGGEHHRDEPDEWSGQ